MSQTAPTSFADLYDQLALWIKQSAWLNAVPEKQKRPRRETKAGALPELYGGYYLIEILFEVGPVKIAGMAGTVAIDETDLLAWQINQGVGLSSWEAQTIRLLSREYAAMLSEATDPRCPAPYLLPVNEMSDERRAKIADAMANWADKLNAKKETKA